MQRLLALPIKPASSCAMTTRPQVEIYMWETTVAEEKKNVHLAGCSEDEFVAWREKRELLTCSAAAASALDPDQHSRWQVA